MIRNSIIFLLVLLSGWQVNAVFACRYTVRDVAFAGHDILVGVRDRGVLVLPEILPGGVRGGGTFRVPREAVSETRMVKKSFFVLFSNLQIARELRANPAPRGAVSCSRASKTYT